MQLFYQILIYYYDFIKNAKKEKIDSIAETYLANDSFVKGLIEGCKLKDNSLFSQTIDAMNHGLFYLAIMGFTGVLDYLLSEYSTQIRNIHIGPRCEAIIQRIEEKDFDSAIESDDYDIYLFMTYPNVLAQFGKNSNFSEPEPDLLNRHWIMHGRSRREYSLLDCIKVITMIYGTVKLGEMGRDDTVS